MKVRACYVWAAMMLTLLALPVLATAKGHPQVDVVVGSAAPELERFAARELCDYLAKLYGIQAYPARALSTASEAAFLIGSPETNATVKRATSRKAFPKVSDQGIVLRRTELEGRPALIVGGGSPRATLWAVYELVERWGVRYLTDRDVLPMKMGEFQVPNLDVVMKPVFRVRAHPSIQDYAPSGESWGMADFRVLIDQLAKMKFSRLNIYPFGYQPYLHWECKGIKRHSALLWYDEHFPITEDMVGRELFSDRSEFWNPDLPLHSSYEELVAAGERQAHNLMEYAHRRGMDCDVSAPSTDFPPEFAPLLKGAVKSGQNTIRPGPNTPIDDPGLLDLSKTVLRATVNTYPEAERILVTMPELKQWLGQYEQAWKALDTKYGLSQVQSLEGALAAAEHRKGSQRWPGKRGVDQFKSDLVYLDYYDRLFQDSGIFKDTLRPNIKFVYGEPAEELFPVLDRILPSGSEVGIHPENQPEHFLPRAEVLATLNTQKVLGHMHVTLDDDGVGIVPQFRPTIIHKVLQALHRYNWSGFVVRERFPGDHDAILAYMARAAWDAKATPDSVTRDLLQHVCGQGCAEEMSSSLGDLESATLNVATNKMSFGYYIRGMVMKFWKAEPTPAYLVQVQEQYGRALEAARRARAKATPEGRWYPDFWVGRLEFALGYARMAEAMHRGATAEAANQQAESLKEAKKALQHLIEATEAYARVARNRTDLGAIAVMNEYGYRPLKTKIAELGK